MQNDRNTKRRLNTVEIQRSKRQLNKGEEKGKTHKRGEITLPVLTQRVGLFWRRRGVVEEASNPQPTPESRGSPIVIVHFIAHLS